MATINQLISEIANYMQQPNNVTLKRAIYLAIIHVRNELIRKTYTNNKTTSKVFQQRYRVELIDIPDGDIPNTRHLDISKIKRSKNIIPRPTRMNDSIPFHSIRTIGSRNNIIISFAKEGVTQYYDSLPGLCNTPTYDYINGYLYIDTKNNPMLVNIKYIIIESVFEKPFLINIETSTNEEDITKSSYYDDEFLIPEDMVFPLITMVINNMIPNIVKQTNEIPTQNLVK